MIKPTMKNRIFEHIDSETGEVWRRVNIDSLCSDYIVSNHGRVFNLSTNTLCNPHSHQDKHNGSLYVHMKNNQRTVQMMLGKLVALSFVDNPHDFKYVIYLDGNRTNNHFTNLVWSAVYPYGSYADYNRWKIDIKSITETNHLPESFWKDLDAMESTPCEDIDNIFNQSSNPSGRPRFTDDDE